MQVQGKIKQFSIWHMILHALPHLRSPKKKIKLSRLQNSKQKNKIKM